MSQVRATSSRRNAAWASSLDRRGCPCRRAVRSPFSRARRTHTIAVDTPTPNRSAVCRTDAPGGRRCKHPLPQILAVSPRHDPPPTLALRNHCSPRLGIPSESEKAEAALDRQDFFLANTCYFIESGEPWLLGLLNSRLAWFIFSGLTNIARGGYLRLRTDFVEQLPIPEALTSRHDVVASAALRATQAAAERLTLQRSVRRRLLELAPSAGAALGRRLEAWWELDFKGVLAEVKKAFGLDLPLKARGEWEAYLSEARGEVERLDAVIAAAERAIDAEVYRLFALTPAEVVLLESAIA